MIARVISLLFYCSDLGQGSCSLSRISSHISVLFSHPIHSAELTRILYMYGEDLAFLCYLFLRSFSFCSTTSDWI